MSTARYDEAKPEDPRARIGKVLGGRYELTDLLASGRSANVYAAKHTELDRRVAVKVLRSKVADDEETRGRFEREARALATLSHPHVVSLLDHGIEEDRPYLVMELLEGQSLADLLAEKTPLPLQAFKIARQVLSALIFAHDNGLLHRDLKPADVFLQWLPGTGDHVKVLDFGLAKFVAGDEEGGPPLTQMGMVRLGEPAYQAPEQLAGQKVDARADVYTVATLLFEMLAGRPPFVGNPDDVMRIKIVEDPPGLHSVRADLDIDPALEKLLAKGLAKSPDARFSSAQEMLSALDQLSQPAVSRKDRPASSAPPPAAASAEGKAERPKWLPLAIVAPVALVVVLVCGGLGVWWLGSGDADDVPRSGDLELDGTTDPWAGDVPPALAEVHAQLDGSRAIDERALQGVRAYAWKHPEDPRPYLLEGHVLFEQGRKVMAIARYERAHTIDAGARGDPRMLRNLVALAAHPQSSERAAGALGDIYGQEALPAIDRALESPAELPEGGAARLRGVRERLAG